MLFYRQIKRRYVQRIFLCMLPVVLTAGCIIIPIAVYENPYEETIPELHMGFTLKHDVIAQFGDPDAKYFQNSEFMYTVTAESGKYFWAVIIPLPGGGGDAGVEIVYGRFVILLSFDNEGFLSNVLVEKTGVNFGACTKSGICFGVKDEVMRYADATAEAHAKDFQALENQCSVYLHGLGKKRAYIVQLDDVSPNYPHSASKYYMVSRKSFIHWALNPGQYIITTAPKYGYLPLSCQAGETNFVHFEYHRFGSSTIQFEDQVTGRAHISNRRLVLLPTGSGGPTLLPPVITKP